jgi:charged multivesicular body protein 3
MDEMMEDVMAADEDEEIEAEADAEVDKVLFDLTDGKLGQAGTVATGLPVSQYSNILTTSTDKLQATGETVDDDEVERSMEQYRAQLNGLLSS